MDMTVSLGKLVRLSQPTGDVAKLVDAHDGSNVLCNLLEDGAVPDGTPVLAVALSDATEEQVTRALGLVCLATQADISAARMVALEQLHRTAGEVLYGWTTTPGCVCDACSKRHRLADAVERVTRLMP